MNKMSQQTLDNKEDEFVKSLNLTDEKIKEDLEEMRDIEGFPLGDFEDLLELSEPPYYTAYPNPYIKDFIEYYGIPYDEETDDYNVEPFVGDVNEGKNDPIYRAHSYHTKVPPKAIIRFIEHYTKKGDIVFDGFCGSGMTGIAAQRLNRYSILSDLAPAAYFISLNYNQLVLRDFYKLFKKWEAKMNEYYITHHNNGDEALINYIVWSDVFECPFCGKELSFWDVSLNDEKTKSFKTFNCPNCSSELTKNKLVRIFIDYFDNSLNKTVKICKQIPVRIYYKYKNKHYFKVPDEFDLDLIKKFDEMPLPYWIPMNKIPSGYNTEQAKKSHGIYYVNQFYTKRAAFILSFLFDKINNVENHSERLFLKWIFTSITPRLASKLAAYRVGKGKSNLTSGILYAPSFQSEVNVFNSFESKLKSLSKLSIIKNKNISSVQSSVDFSNIPENSIDYIFIDPPFGSNLMYSELNFIWESWLKVFTNNDSEAIINSATNKDSEVYKHLLTGCFKEFFRILKPNRWITVEFHNSKAEIWNIIRDSITKSGFIIAQVAILDKKQGSFKQVTSPGSVKNDLVINAYKPEISFSKSFSKQYGVNLESKFLDLHLNKLPISQNIERTEQMLYSKYLAQYLQNGFEVRLDSSDFSNILRTNYVERDGFWFTEIQAMKYDENLSKHDLLKKIDLKQSILGIDDEKTALIWLSQFLKEPKTYDEIYKEYVKKLIISQDNIPELKELLDENFIITDGKYTLPSNIEKTTIGKLRIKKLSKDFDSLLNELKESKSKIKEVRKEALLYGLTSLYKEKDVDTIKLIGDRIDAKIIESDEDISAIINWAKFK